MSHRNYSDDTRRETVQCYVERGLTEASRRTGVSQPTIVRWAKEAGVDGARISDRLVQRNRRAAAVAGAKRLRDHEEAREQIASELTTVVRLVIARARQVLAHNEFGPDTIQPLAALLREGVKNMELLGGHPTSRVSYETDKTELIAGVALAFQAILPTIVELAGEEAADRIRRQFADEVRAAVEKVEEQRDREVLELEAGEVEEADEAAA